MAAPHALMLLHRFTPPAQAVGSSSRPGVESPKEFGNPDSEAAAPAAAAAGTAQPASMQLRVDSLEAELQRYNTIARD